MDQVELVLTKAECSLQGDKSVEPAGLADETAQMGVQEAVPAERCPSDLTPGAVP